MNRFLAPVACALLASACGKTHTVPPPQPPEAPKVATGPVSGIDKSNFDAGVRPQDDLYKAIDGRWLASTPIPKDRSNFGAFTQLEVDAEEQIHAIADELAARKDAVAGSNQEKIARLYSAFMDEAAVETAGLKPLEADLALVDGIKDRKDLAPAMADLMRTGVNVPLLPVVHQDAKDSTRYAGDLRQGGLSLPNRDFYLSDEPNFVELRKGLSKHIAQMYKLAGWPDGEAAGEKILALETKVAEGQWDKVLLRDPVKTYNPYEAAKLSTLTKAIDWPAYLDRVGFGHQPVVLVGQPTYVTELGKLMQSEPLDTWKTYLRWHLLLANAPFLPKAFVDENFAYYGKQLNGIDENEPRWKRGVGLLEGTLGEAIGEIYVARHFPAESKARMETLVQNLIKAYGPAIDELDWMSPETKKAAREKLAKFTYKIGYPKHFRDYSKLTIEQGDLIANVARANAFEYQRNIDKLGGPIDRDEWQMTPQTINAYYNPELNEIVFPAAILQPPFFDAKADDAANYGAIGAVIGHEITHGFDDQGAQYDGDGNLRVWWSKDDLAKFQALGARLAAQYDAYEPVKGSHVNGRFTLGENIADLGGLTIAHAAWKLSLDGGEAPVLDGLTGDQRFFMGWAQAWRRNYREENLINRLKIDPHSPSEYRCNGVVVNIPAFMAAFDVKEGDGLYRKPEDQIKIW